MALYDLSKANEYDRSKFVEKVKEFLDKGVVVNMSKKLQQRTPAQNKYLHLLLGFFGSEYGLSIDEVKCDLLKRLVNPDLFVRVKINKHGRQVQYLRSTSELDSGELTLAIERFRNWSASQCGIYLPAPNEQSFLTYCEKVIEQNKEFM